MLTEERHQRILALLEESEIVKVSELIQQLQASESTIRRDLQELEGQNALVRIHGGAKKVQQLGFEPNMKEKTQKFQAEKQKIAQYAVSLIKNEEVIYLDAGTTTLEMIPFLSTISDLKVVTNSVKHASLLIDQGIETLILGGTIKISTNAVLGSGASEQLRKLRFNRCFIGMNGAHLEAGFTTPDPEEAMIKKIALENSQKAYVLVDHSKFQQTTFAQVSTIENAEIITDFCPKSYLAKFRSKTTVMEVSE
ncbi:DeoR/GlpR family DNA-binding transcription regulator [Enterococcus sp.]|uniref:DeoR/GlpR family DNA-binding transcription regulator n=1 Tax=Enterococcus sp. TaxID=35783 RepID=UPI0025C12B9D|nr:DeoR/GlpR family DNA-binding transcription regulator [Enterococcus sp.]